MAENKEININRYSTTEKLNNLIKNDPHIKEIVTARGFFGEMAVTDVHAALSQKQEFRGIDFLRVAVGKFSLSMKFLKDFACVCKDKQLYDIAVFFKGIKSFIKNTNENWWIFFSGVISSVPISLLLSFTNFASGLPGFILPLGFACLFSFLTTIFAFLFTTTLLSAKEKLKEIKQETFHEKTEYDSVQDLHNLAEFNADKWLTEDSKDKNSTTKYAKQLKIYCWHFFIATFITLIFIGWCWAVVFIAKG